MKSQTIEIKGKELKVEIADTPLSRAKGLSFRSKGKMLFKLRTPSNMKVDMMFLSKPLYLYFFDENRKLIEKQKAEPWTWNPKTWTLYSPERSYKYLLESFERLEIEEGDKFKE